MVGFSFIVSNCDLFSGQVNSVHRCGDWISNCSSWRRSQVGVPALFSLCVLFLFFFPVNNMFISCFECTWSSAAINRLINLSEATIATGDDEGCIKVWDTRQRTCCNTFAAHQEYVSDMCYASDSMKLLGTRYSSDFSNNKSQLIMPLLSACASLVHEQNYSQFWESSYHVSLVCCLSEYKNMFFFCLNW